MPPIRTATATLASGTEDAAYTIKAADLLQCFSDPDGDLLSISGLTASSAMLSNKGDGTWTLTPVANFNGSVALNYAVVDGKGGSVAGSRSLNITPVNDAPSVTGAVQGTAAEDGALSTLSALANASDVEAGTTLSVVNVPTALPAGAPARTSRSCR